MAYRQPKLQQLTEYIIASRTGKKPPKYIDNIEDDKYCIEAQLFQIIMIYVGIDLGFYDNKKIQNHITAKVYFKGQRRFGWSRCNDYIGAITPNMQNLYIIDSLNCKYATIAGIENYQSRNPRHWSRPIYQQKIPKTIDKKQTNEIYTSERKAILNKIETISFGNIFAYMIDNNSNNMIITDNHYKKLYKIPLQSVTGINNISLLHKFKTNDEIRCIWRNLDILYMVTTNKLYKIKSNVIENMNGFELSKCNVVRCKNSCFYSKPNKALFIVCNVDNGIDLRIIFGKNSKNNNKQKKQKKMNVSFRKKYVKKYKKFEYILSKSSLNYVLHHKSIYKNCFILMLTFDNEKEFDIFDWNDNIPNGIIKLALCIRINFKERSLQNCYVQCGFKSDRVKKEYLMVYDNNKDVMVTRNPLHETILKGYQDYDSYQVNCTDSSGYWRRTDQCQCYVYDLEVTKLNHIFDNFKWIPLFSYYSSI